MTPEEFLEHQALERQAKAFLAKCEDTFNRVRQEKLEGVANLKEKHLREFVTFSAFNEALRAKLDAIRQANGTEIVPFIREHYQGVCAQLATHDKLLAKITDKAHAAESERNRGREIARRNAQVGIEKAEHALLAEIERHNQAVGRLDSPAAIEAEDSRHAKRMAELELKAEGALAALAAVSDDV